MLTCMYFFLVFTILKQPHSDLMEKDVHYVVRSYLNCPKYKDVIEHIVQLRSRVQAAGNLVFTQAVLLACDKPLPKEMVSQAFIGGMYAIRVCKVRSRANNCEIQTQDMRTIPTKGTTGSNKPDDQL